MADGLSSHAHTNHPPSTYSTFSRGSNGPPPYSRTCRVPSCYEGSASLFPIIPIALRQIRPTQESANDSARRAAIAFPSLESKRMSAAMVFEKIKCSNAICDGGTDTSSRSLSSGNLRLSKPSISCSASRQCNNPSRVIVVAAKTLSAGRAISNNLASALNRTWGSARYRSRS